MKRIAIILIMLMFAVTTTTMRICFYGRRIDKEKTRRPRVGKPAGARRPCGPVMEMQIAVSAEVPENPSSEISSCSANSTFLNSLECTPRRIKRKWGGNAKMQTSTPTKASENASGLNDSILELFWDRSSHSSTEVLLHASAEMSPHASSRRGAKRRLYRSTESEASAWIFSITPENGDSSLLVANNKEPEPEPKAEAEKNGFSITIMRVVRECLETVDAELQNANTILKDERLRFDANRAMLSVDMVWIHSIKALQCTNETYCIPEKTHHITDEKVGEAEELELQIIDVARVNVKNALNAASMRWEYADARLLNAVRALENADACKNAWKLRLELFEIIQKSLKILTMLIVENLEGTRDQSSNDGMGGFREAMLIFNEALQAFDEDIRDKKLAEQSNKLLREMKAVKRVADGLQQGAAITGMPLPRIVDGMQRAVHSMLRNAGFDIMKIDEKLQNKKRVLFDALSVPRSELRKAEKAKHAAETAIKNIGGLDAAKRPLEIENAKQKIQQMRECISKAKEGCKTMCEEFNKLVEMAYNENTEDACILQNIAMERKRSIMLVLKKAYSLGKDTIVLEQGIADVLPTENRPAAIEAAP